MLPRLTLLPIVRAFTAVCSLLPDNDSDDDVNGGSPRQPPDRQHRKEKKEFPVSQNESHWHLDLTATKFMVLCIFGDP